MISRLLLAAVAASLIGGSADAQSLSLSAPLSPRGLPAGVTIPTIAPTAVVYPGCPTPPTTFGNVWAIDAVNGHTMSDYTNGTNGAPVVTTIGGASGQGTVTHPWNSLLALWGAPISGTQSPLPGYTTMLLSTAPHGGFSVGPILPGDDVIIMTGNYGKIKGGDPFTTGINSPPLTITAGTGQTPVLSYINLINVAGFVFDGTNGDFKIQSQNDDGAALFSVGELNGAISSNVALNHMDISSAPVATADTWTQAQWRAVASGTAGGARLGVVLTSSGGCPSVVNSHVSVTYGHNLAGIDAFGSNALVQNNEIDHFDTDGVDFSGSNVAILSNNIHDTVNTNDGFGDVFYGIRNTGIGSQTPSLAQTNVSISRNKMVESTDASAQFDRPLNGYLNSNGDVTNFSFYDNLFAGTGNFVIGVGNTHNGIICNNSAMSGGQFEINQGHAGTTGPEGNVPSNIRICNNIVPFMTFYGSNVEADHNISTNIFPFSYTYSWAGTNWAIIQESPPSGSVTTAATDAASWCATHDGFTGQNLAFCVASAGPSNIFDGISQSNEFTNVPNMTVFPWTTQPNWTPLSGSPAKTSGAAVLIPPLLDFNGAASTSIGALN